MSRGKDPHRVSSSRTSWRTVTHVANCPSIPSTTPCTPVALDVSGGNAVLALFATGIRNRAKLSDVMMTINGQNFPAFFAGPTPGDPGVDLIEAALPSTLVHNGIVFVTVCVAEIVSNQVTVYFP